MATGSAPLVKTIGIVVVAALAASAANVPPPAVAAITANLTVNEIGRQCRQSIILIFRPAEFDRHILALNETRLSQTLAECSDKMRSRAR